MKVVGIGASAGGIEALGQFFDHLPDNTNAAYVVVQHLSPHFKSIMDELLRKHTQMPTAILHKNCPIQPNHIYLMPGDKSLIFERGMLILQDRISSETLNLPIDKFFHSLGNAQRENAIAVVLSGSGTDGSRGVRTIKEKGGLVLVQSPKSSQFTGMPDSVIQLNIADSVLPPAELAQKLTQVLRKGIQINDSSLINLEIGDDKEIFNRVISRIGEVSGIHFSKYKEPTLLRRMEKRMLLLQFDSIKEYYKFLNSDEQETNILSREFLIGVTHFFRDPEAFKALQTKILPLIFDNLDESEQCRIWVPACSTGEEAYSIGMILMNYLERTNSRHDFKIFATDVMKSAITHAAEGRYSFGITADVPVSLLNKYFDQTEDCFEVKKILRDKILFAVHNVLENPPFIRMNLISCRNFLIYLKPEAQHKVLSTFHFALNPNNYMFLGPSESLGDLKSAYLQIDKRWNIFEKVGDSYIPERIDYSHISPKWKTASAKENKKLKLTPMVTTSFRHEFSDPFSRHLIEFYAPLTLFLNRELDILYINGDLEKVLTLPRAVVRLNLHRMIDQKAALIFKNGVEEALQGDTSSLYKNIVLTKNKKAINTNLHFRKVNLEGIGEPVVMVEINLLQDQPAEKEKIKEVQITEEAFLRQKIQTLEHELKNRKKELQKLINELESTNEELQVSNRELLASNEELQSTNEELQSVNEELYTVNTELQSKNKDLSTANNDINNLLKSTDIGTIFLDNDLRIRRFTPSIRRQFDLVSTDIGRSISTFSSSFENLNLSEICQEVFDSLKVYEREVTDVDSNSYLLRVLPYRTETDVIKGLVITFVSIDEILKSKKEAADLTLIFRSIFRNSSGVIMLLSTEGKVIRVNKPFGNYKISELENQNLLELLPEPAQLKISAALKQVQTTKTREQFRIELKDKAKNKRYFEIIFTPIVDDSDSNTPVSMISMLANDVSTQVLARKELEKAKKIYRSFMANALHQIALVDRQGIMHEVNYARNTGKKPEELIGTSIYDYLPKDQRQPVKETIEAIFKGKSSGKVNFRFVRPDGEEIHVSLVATPVIINNKVDYVALIGDRIVKSP